MKAHVFAVAALAATTGMAMANVVVFNGDTTGGPTYNRVLSGSPPTGLSGVGTAVHYQVVPVYTDFTGSVNFEITSGGFDTFMSLYSGSFNSGNALADIVIADDDAGAGSLSLFAASLTGGAQYYVVVTGFGNADFGTYQLQMSSTSSNITIGVVPAPGAVAMLGLTGLVAGRRRR